MADRLEFEIDVELETGLITGHAGVPGLIEAFRQTGTAAVIDREIKLKSRKRGLSASEMVESLLAAGSERAEDLDQFRKDKALGCCWSRAAVGLSPRARPVAAQLDMQLSPASEDGNAGCRRHGDCLRQRAAKRVYDGNRGYQPVLALWAEQDVILADESVTAMPCPRT